MIDKNIAFIGAGFMGGALIRGMVKSKTIEPQNITAVDPRPEILDALKSETAVNVTDDNNRAVANADIVVLGVKPQILEGVVREISGSISSKKLVISIAAGVRISSFESWLGKSQPIIRAMPNMGAAVGSAATAVSASAKAGAVEIETAKKIFDSVGKTVVVDEKLLDTVTAISGSGPAYVFLFLEAMTEAGTALGLSKETAYELSLATFYGSAKLAMATGQDPASLRESISSPGGTTLAGLASFEKEGFREIVKKSVKIAMERSLELGK